MLSITAQQNARAFLLVPQLSKNCHVCWMRDWAFDYILHVLKAKNWSANRLATEAGVAASTINRPLRVQDWPHKLSRTTLTKIHEVSGIDPKPFIPAGFAEDADTFASQRPLTLADRALRNLDKANPNSETQPTNEIKIAVVGKLAQIAATLDRAGIAKLRAKLDAIESMLDD